MQAEKEIRDNYLIQIKKRYLQWDLDIVINALKRSFVNKAVIKTSSGNVKRDPLCVFTRPIYDEATFVAYVHTDEIVNLWREKVAVIDLAIERANRENLEKVFQELSPLFYHHCGHGTEEALLGKDHEKIIDSDNINFLKGCLVNTLACNSEKLGKLSIEKGCIGFFAQRRDFKVLTDISIAKLLFDMFKEKPPSREDVSLADNFVRETLRSAIKHDKNNSILLGDLEAKIHSFGDIDKEKYYDLING